MPTSAAAAMLGGAQLRPQQHVATDHVERQITIVVVIGVEVPAFLQAVHQMAHGVQVQDDFARMFGQTAHGQFQQALLQRLRLVGDLVAARLLVIAQFDPVQGAGRGQRFALLIGAAVLGQRIGLAGRRSQQRVPAQQVMVVEVLIAQGQAVNPLGHQLGKCMLDEDLLALIDKTGGDLAAQAQAQVDLAQEQRAAVAAEVAAAEVGDDAAGAQIGEGQRLGVGQPRQGRQDDAGLRRQG